jgi:hypothetical protein
MREDSLIDCRITFERWAGIGEHGVGTTKYAQWLAWQACWNTRAATQPGINFAMDDNGNIQLNGICIRSVFADDIPRLQETIKSTMGDGMPQKALNASGAGLGDISASASPANTSEIWVVDEIISDLASYLEGFEKLSKAESRIWVQKIMVYVLRPHLRTSKPVSVCQDEGCPHYGKAIKCDPNSPLKNEAEDGKVEYPASQSP